MTIMAAHQLTWAIIVAATAGVIVRPFRLPEAIWAVAGAILLVVLGLLPISAAFSAVAEGNDVYLFLTGMMLMSETARHEGLFDWVATFAVNAANGSSRRLFILVYFVGVVITVFLSNDATAVVLTPAVFAATRKAKVEPLPFLFICAFIANAASFVLPISNPANLVLYGAHVPPLRDWLARFAAPSVISILATYAALRFMERGSLGGTCNRGLPQEKFTPGSWIALSGISATAIVLLTVSAMGMPLGLPTAIMGFLTALAVLVSQRTSPWTIAKGVSWSILPLVAGLFILVEGLNRTGVVALLAHLIQSAGYSLAPTAAAGTIIALGSNVINNLPAGLIARSVLQTAHATRALTDSILIGVDLGPNLSVTGSLATILWLSVIRREGEDVSFGRFFKAGLVVMPPALILALAFRLI